MSIAVPDSAERWRIIIFLAAQTVGAIIWGSRLDYRVQVLEAQQVVQDARIEKLELIVAKVAVLDERQLTFGRRLEVQTDKINQLLGLLGEKKNGGPQ